MPHLRIGLLPLALVALTACSDYNLEPKTDAGALDDTAGGTDPWDTNPPDVDACDGAEDPDPIAVELNTECETSLQTGSFNPVLEWNYPTGTFCGPPAAGQIVDSNGNGSIDDADMPVIVAFVNGRVLALYGDGSGVAWQTTASYGQDGGFSIADLDGDGWGDVVVGGTNQVCALRGRDGTQMWCTPSLSSSMDPLGYNYPAVADMDGDGVPEVTMGNAIIDGPTGSVLARGAGSGIGAAPYSGTGTGGYYGSMSVPIDMDADGKLELVTGNAAYNMDGSVKWSYSGLDGLPAVADFDGDGEGELVKTSGSFVEGLETDGSLAWGPINFSGNLGAPAIDDLDGDGTPDFVFAAQNELVAMTWGGGELWRTPISDQSGAAGPVLFDFELDGYPEVLYADETSVRFFSGLDGTPKFNTGGHNSYTILETPIVADVDNDGQVEIVLGHCQGPGALTVYGDADGTWPAGRKSWTQHAYHISHIGEGLTVTGTGNNWPLYNSFRSGDIGAPPNEYWDLRAQILDVCDDECDTTGIVYVAAWVLNAGNLEAPPGVPVSIRAGAGGTILDSVVLSAAIPPGQSGEMVTFEVAADDIRGTAPAVTADEDGSGFGVVGECQEDNNIDGWLDTVCD